MTTEHSQDRKCLIFPEGGKPDGLENPRGTAENQRTTQLTYGPGRESNRGHLGERPVLQAQANHAPQYWGRWFLNLHNELGDKSSTRQS